MPTLLKVLINLADIKSAGGVALRVGIQEEYGPAPRRITPCCPVLEGAVPVRPHSPTNLIEFHARKLGGTGFTA